MGRFYSITVDQIAVSAVQDLIEINAPATGSVVIHSAEFGQHSDAADAEAEMLQITISRATASGSGGSAVTPIPHQFGDAASAVTAERNNTTQATTTTPIRATTWNIQAGYIYAPTPEERISIPPSGRIVFELPVAPGDEITLSGTVVIEELD